MKKTVAALTMLFVFLSGQAMAAPDELVVYSARKEHLVKDLFEKYEKEQGVKITYITGEAPVLLQRILSEGENTAADILLTVDAGNLWHAAEKNILVPVTSPVLDRNIPDHYKDPDNRWFGLSVRARTIVYNTDRVKKDELSTYEALAGEDWKGRLLLRTSKKVYNQSLVAMLIATLGEDKTRSIVGVGDQPCRPPLFQRHQGTGGDCRGPGRCRDREHLLLRPPHERKPGSSPGHFLGRPVG